MEDLGRIKLFEYTIRLFQDGNQFFEKNFKNNVLVVGRDDQCDLIIQDRSISRRHLCIEVDIDKFYVSDMGSSNGTFVNNVRIDGKTEIDSQSHIRAGKITVQVITPEFNRAVKLESASPEASDEPTRNDRLPPEPPPKRARPTRAKEDPPEMTLSKIAINLEQALQKTDHQEDVMAMVDRDFVEEMTAQHESSAVFISKKIESLALWNGQIFDIQEFGYHDTIVVGPDHSDSIHIPSVDFRWALSTYEFKEAVFKIPKNMNIFAIRGKSYLSKEQLISENRIREDKNTVQIQISHYDILRVEVDANTQLYFRYVPSTVELGSKHLLNPDVLIKKALVTSLIFHLVLSLTLFFIPKDRLKTKEVVQPTRIAKLLVEEKPLPPPVVIPPPEPIPEPEPPPPPPEEKKPEPPPPKPPPVKAEPPKPKPKPKKEIPKPVPKKLQPPPKPVQKTSQVVQKPVAVQKPVQMNPVGNNKPAGPKSVSVQPRPAPAPPAPPPPKPVDISKLGALAAMSGLKLDTKSNKAAPAINIAANSANTNTGNAVGMNSMTSELKTQTEGKAGGTGAGPIKTKGSGSVAGGYGTEGIGTGTGKRGVKGAVAGSPQLSVGSGKTEGLSREQVLKALQPHLGKIQSCYERSLLADPNLAGRIEFEWNIASSGSVKSVDIKKNSVAGGEQLGECVVGVIKSIKFPSASNGQETNPAVGFPFGRL